jgi:CheY-like chemotaxis protein
MDLNMPGLDGYETTRRIRALEDPSSRTPIIALTANKASAYREACLLAGMDDILTKPYSLEALTELLRRLVHTPDTVRRAAAPSGAPRNLTLVDVSGMAQIGHLGGSTNNTLFPRLVALFEANVGEALAQIDAALRMQQWETARQAAHKLRGAAGNVGAHEFAAQLAELEARCNELDAPVARHSHVMLRAALPALLDTLRRQCLQASA